MEEKSDLVEAYWALRDEYPETTVLYGKMDWPSGERFCIHCTHQNVLSVDIMVPGLWRGKPVTTGLFNKFGYGVNFDEK